MLAKLIALVVPLGLDTFVVAAALGVGGMAPERRFGLSVLMTSFEAGMPLVGLAAGAPLGRTVGGAATGIAIAVLLAFGLRTLLWEAGSEALRVDRLGSVNGFKALALGISVSLDELAIGFTLGLLHLPVIPVIVLIALQAFVVCQAGLRLGARLSCRLREGAERLSGLALVGLGLALLAEQVLAG